MTHASIILQAGNVSQSPVKSLKMDKNQERVKAFVRRFVQVMEWGWGGTEFVAEDCIY